MNTANLQLEGLLLALSSLIDTMTRKGLLTQQEVDEALARAETVASSDSGRPSEVSGANVEAICFPIRFLRLTAMRGADEQQSFSQIATAVGRQER